MVERESESPDRAAPQSQPPGRPGSGRPDAPATVLALQRTAGNRAVQRVISSTRPTTLRLSGEQTRILRVLSGLMERLDALALTVSLYFQATLDKHETPDMTPEEKATVDKLKQSPELFQKLVAEIGEQLETRDRVAASLGMTDAPESLSHLIFRVRPYNPGILTVDELESGTLGPRPYVPPPPVEEDELPPLE